MIVVNLPEGNGFPVPPTAEEKAAIDWAKNGPLVRWADGLWRGLGANLGDDDFDHEIIVRLVDARVFNFTSAGVELAVFPDQTE